MPLCCPCSWCWLTLPSAVGVLDWPSLGHRTFLLVTPPHCCAGHWHAALALAEGSLAGWEGRLEPAGAERTPEEHLDPGLSPSGLPWQTESVAINILFIFMNLII